MAQRLPPQPAIASFYKNSGNQVRCLLEGTSPEDILARWHQLLPERMAAWGLERHALVELFGSTRDAWMAADLDGWLAPNRIYPGVAEAVRALMAAHEVFIVTTKQARPGWGACSASRRRCRRVQACSAASQPPAAAP